TTLFRSLLNRDPLGPRVVGFQLNRAGVLLDLNVAGVPACMALSCWNGAVQRVGSASFVDTRCFVDFSPSAFTQRRYTRHHAFGYKNGANHLAVPATHQDDVPVLDSPRLCIAGV